MTKRDAESPGFRWDNADEIAEAEDTAPEFAGGQPAPARPGFHLHAARRIEEARERRQLRKATEDFDDYDV